MKNWIIGIIIVLIFVIGGFFSMNRTEPIEVPTEEETPDIENTTLEAGNFTVTQGTTVGWQGRKPLLNNYFDQGTLAIKSGTVSVDANKNITGTIVFDMTTITALSTGRGEGQDRLSTHLKSDDFFGVVTHPEATFEITSVQPTETAGQYTVNGNLTIKGVTNPVQFLAFIYSEDNNLNVKGVATLDRSKWDVRFGSGTFFTDLGDNIIDDNFTVAIDLEATKQ